jgi:hypothetical protein
VWRCTLYWLYVLCSDAQRSIFDDTLDGLLSNDALPPVVFLN